MEIIIIRFDLNQCYLCNQEIKFELHFKDYTILKKINMEFISVLRYDLFL